MPDTDKTGDLKKLDARLEMMILINRLELFGHRGAAREMVELYRKRWGTNHESS